jgi:solute carrier family 25 (mitochondrial phosphate transporter), member 23/24/25/41
MLSQTGEHNSSSIVSSSPTTTTTTDAAAAAKAASKRSPQHRPPGIMALYRDILRHEGVLGLWAGNGVNLLRVFPAKAIVFSSNDVYKAFLFNLFMPDAARNNSSKSNSNKSLSGPLSFLAGGMAGMTACFFTYPLDLARGRISGKLAGPAVTAVAAAAPPVSAGSSGGAAAAVQLTSSATAAAKSTKIYKGITQTIVLTVKDEGFMALFKGVTPTILGAMPYEGIKFGTVGVLEWYFPKEDGFLHHPHYPWRKMVFGGLGGVMAGLITYPNDTVRRMLQLQGSRSRVVAASSSSTAAAAVPAVPTFTGYWDCVRYIYRHYGISRFYSGCAINIIRMAPNTAIQFGSYELLKKWTDDMFE